MEKKSKIKNWKYDFLFVHKAAGWAAVSEWNDGKPVRNPFGKPKS